MESSMASIESADAGGTAKDSGRREGRDHCGHAHDEHHVDGKARVRDPVCGMTVDPATSRHRFDTRGETFHFCSAGCRAKFAASRKSILAAASPTPPRRRTRSTPARCIRRSARSVPETARSAAWRWSPRWHRSMRRQIRACGHDAALLDRPWAFASGGGPGDGRSSCRRHGWIDQTLSNLDSAAVRHPVVLWAGWPFFVRGWQSLVTRNLNMFT